MSRIMIELPDKFIFSTEVYVRVNDLNRSNHVGNHTLISYINEAYCRLIKS